MQTLALPLAYDDYPPAQEPPHHQPTQLPTMSESEDDLPTSVFQTVGGARPFSSEPLVYDESRHGLFNFEGSSEDEDEASQASVATPLYARPNLDALNSSGRGRYNREAAAKKLGHADQAHAAWNSVFLSALAGACRPDCPHRCTDRLSREEMFSCIGESYGVIAWISEAELKVAKRRPGVVYGKLTEHDGDQGRWALRMPPSTLCKRGC